MIKFPKDFLWGAATSSHQVEGDNLNNDWWEWERQGKSKEPSGKACRHYTLYREDLDLAKQLGHNAHRFSVEWSRIEPKEGVFDPQELEHYRRVIRAVKERGMEPLVTLHHFTSPQWFAARGGWENRGLVKYYLRYVEYIVGNLASDVRFWITINEPNIYAYLSYVTGVWPPQKKEPLAACRVMGNFAQAHINAYRAIKGIYKKNGLAEPMISIAQNMQALEACSPGIRNKLAVYLRDRIFNFAFINKVARKKALDFIGLNYYNRGLVEVRGWGVRNLFFDLCESNHKPLPRNSLGWDIYPEGLYLLLRKLKRYRLPVFILENGICTEDDALRWDFIRAHLDSAYRAIKDGVKVMGYIYWSLMDNYEWDKGFAPRFGLIGIDYATYERKVRPSAEKFAGACRTGSLDE